MWFPTPTADSLTRPRIAVAVVSAVTAATACYYLYQQTSITTSQASEATDGSGAALRRSNAIRRPGRPRRRDTHSSSSSEAPGDENVDTTNESQPLADAETMADADEWWEVADSLPQPRAGHNIVNLLFRVSEDNARRNGCVHRGCLCNSCGVLPIRGIRYRCANCADFDLCETCEAQGVHTKTHVFYKIRVPAPPFGTRRMQPVWYTGDPDSCPRGLPKALIGKLSMETGFERPELEAAWEQWTFMANTEWRDDPDDLGIAMDRKTFERCLVPTGGSRNANPNLIHDRMFAFYDSNKDGLIGFSEFLYGLSYRTRGNKLRKIFEGYDLDGDGYVSRRDFLRMFRAYYVLYKQMHRDILDGLEDQLLASTEAQQLVASRQPLSSLFGREGPVPHGDRNLRLDGKILRRDGSVEVAPGTSTIAADTTDTARREDILTSLFAYAQEPNARRRLFPMSSTQRTRTIRPDADRPYLVTLIDPPQTLDGLPDAVMGTFTLDNDNGDDEDDVDGENTSGEEDGEDHLASVGPDGTPPTETEQRLRALSYNRRRIPRLEKHRRDMARAQMHDRWKRRQFYLDEEEGGNAPYDWNDNEDIFLREVEGNGESSQPADEERELSRSRSNSKAHFANEADSRSSYSSPPSPSSSSTSVRSIFDMDGSHEVIETDRDAGQEILYQITQQAFNELLDTIFKPAEDIAVEARETKEIRARHKEAIDAYVIPVGPEDGEQENEEPPQPESSLPDERQPSDKSLSELLFETGYTIIEEVEPEDMVDPAPNDAPEPTPEEHKSVAKDDSSEKEGASRKDPTMPQFRPNSLMPGEGYDPKLEYYPSTGSAGLSEDDSPPEEPTVSMLGHWKDLGKAEETAKERGGWGKLSYDEFESIFRSQEYRGNRLDYLGSWIDFCIP